MSYYAKVLDGKVLDVMVADATFMNSYEDETPGTWIETSRKTRGGILYNADGTQASDQSGALRKNTATKDGNYDKWNDAFYNVQPFSSWTLNSTSFYGNLRLQIQVMIIIGMKMYTKQIIQRDGFFFQDHNN